MRESQDHPLRPATVERLFLLWEQRGTKGIRVMIPKKGSLVPLHDKVILLPWERGTQNPCNSYWKTLCRRLFASSQRAAEESSFMLCLVQICPSNLEFSTEEVNQSSAILTKVQHSLLNKKLHSLQWSGDLISTGGWVKHHRSGKCICSLED